METISLITGEIVKISNISHQDSVDGEPNKKIQKESSDIDEQEK